MIDAFLARYCEFFENLRPERLHQVDQLFDQDALFRDPFNDVQGRPAIRRIFEHLLTDYPRTRFRVIESCPTHHSAFIRWTFQPDSERDLQIEGVSRVIFNAKGEVLDHRDYWDSASELFAHLPFTRGPVRWLLRKGQACRADQRND